MPLVLAEPRARTDTPGSLTRPGRCPLYIAFRIQAPHGLESGKCQ